MQGASAQEWGTSQRLPSEPAAGLRALSASPHESASTAVTPPSVLGRSSAPSETSRDSPGGPDVVPRRLWIKTSPLNLDSLVPLPLQGIEELQHPSGGNPPQHPSGASGPDEEEDDKEKVFREFCQRYRRWFLAKEIAEKDIREEREVARLKRRCQFRRMSAEQKVAAAEAYFTAHPNRKDSDVVLAYLTEARTRVTDRTRQRDSNGGKFLDYKAVLLTFHGPWGEVKDIELPPPSSVDMIDYVCERWQEHERMKQLWLNFMIVTAKR